MNNRCGELCRFPRLLSTSAFTSVDNSLLDLHNSSHHTQPHSMLANYTVKPHEVFGITNDAMFFTPAIVKHMVENHDIKEPRLVEANTLCQDN